MIRSDSFTVSEGVTLDAQLGFQAFSAIVDNYTQSWAYMPAVTKYIPPHTCGITIPFDSGTQALNLQWFAPPGYTQPPVGNAQLTIQAFSTTLPPTVGTPMSAGGTNSITKLTSAVASTFGSGAVTQVFAIPPATTHVLLSGQRVNSGSGGAFVGPWFPSVTGVQSGKIYGDSQSRMILQDDPIVCVLDPIDTQLSIVTAQNGSVFKASGYVALLANATPNPHRVAAWNYGPMGTPTQFTHFSNTWTVASGDNTLIAGPTPTSTAQIALDHIYITIDATVAGAVLQLWDGPSADAVALMDFAVINSVGPHSMPFHGHRLRLGKGLVLTANGGSITARGYATYWNSPADIP